MVRRKKRFDEPSVTLFPFLAVLVCTMGILIVLLVIAVKAADSQAAQSIQDYEKQQAELDELQFLIEQEQLRNESLHGLRPELQTQLSRQRSQRGYVEDEVRLLREKIKQQQSANLAVQSKAENISTNDQSKLQAHLQTLIESTKMLVEEKRNAYQTKADSYSVVPFAGASGTGRRPIYIECTAQGLTIQPLNIHLDVDQFTVPLLPGNPLDASLLAIRQYMDRHQLAGSEGSAYPLLIVRPGGESNFALARRAMVNWADEFGYELVDESKKLDFGDPDLNLVDIVNETVQDALVNQEKMVSLLKARGQKIRQLGDGNSQVSSTTSSKNKTNGSLGAKESGSGLFDGTHQTSAPSRRQSGVNSNQSIDSALDSSTQKIAGEKNGTHFVQTSSKKNDHTETTGSPLKPMSENEADGNAGIGSQVNYSTSDVQKSRKQNWALPSSTANAVAYRRPLNIKCELDRILIESGEYSNLPDFEITLENGRSTNKVVDEFVQSIWTIIDSWGIAGPNGYWKPVLNIQAEPGSESNREQLKQLLQNSGLEFRQ